MAKPITSSTRAQWAKINNKLIRLRGENAELTAALQPFAQLCPGGLGNVGGGTLIASDIKIRWVKEARDALAKHKEK